MTQKKQRVQNHSLPFQISKMEETKEAVPKMKKVSIKRDIFLLIVMLIPILCALVIVLITTYTGTASLLTYDIQALMKNISYFAIGMSLLIRPSFLTRTILMRLKVVDENNTVLTSFLRILGAVLVILTLFSSRFLILELLKNVQQ